ncbi:MAG: hypothetical protein ACYTEL_22965 [Planctomycetota bacterium]
MDFDSPQLQEHVLALRDIDFELAYLALLTAQGLKPLSRWEKPVDEPTLSLLQQIGLITRQIRRTVKTGREVIETIFSGSAGYIELYEKRFAATPIDKSPATTRFEGFLFGFPPCCVDQYIRHRYAKNDLDPQDQKILFHWACRGCKITPILVPAYRRTHEYVEQRQP